MPREPFRGQLLANRTGEGSKVSLWTDLSTNIYVSNNRHQPRAARPTRTTAARLDIFRQTKTAA
jgi:hypothetical protein